VKPPIIVQSQRAAAVARELALARRQRDARLLREELHLPAVVGPAHRLFQPARTERLEQARALDRRGQIPAAVHVDHQVPVGADHLAHQREPLDVLAERHAAGLGLEAGMALGLEHLHLVAQLGERLAVAVVSAGHVAGHDAAVAAEQPVERQAGDLADQIPGGEVDRCRDAHQRLPRPLLLRREALPGEREQLLVERLRRERVGAHHELAEAAFQRMDRRLDRGVARGDADALDAFVGMQAHEDLVRLRHDEMAHPVRPPVVRRAQHVRFQSRDFHGGGKHILPT
jgi:hypothetical protein